MFLTDRPMNETDSPALDAVDQTSVPHLRHLVRVAQRITAEHDIANLCETILEEARVLTNADGGTLYLAEGHGASQRLEFAIMRNRTLNLALGGSSGRGVHYPALPMYIDGEQNHHHVATHAGLSGRLVNVDDVYATEHYDFTGTKEFDRRFDYRTRSILTVPLRTEFGELVAVMQLINACDHDSGQVVAFSADSEPVVNVLASFAAIALQQQRVMHDQKELLIALSGEPNTGRLVERILSEAQAITNADGGTLYLYRDDDQRPRLEFVLVRNDTLRYNLGGSSGAEIHLDPIPLYLEDGSENHHHVAAHAALTGRTINIADAYQSEEFDFSGTKAFDQAQGYRSASFLTIPLLNHLDEVIGVLQLVNSLNPHTRQVTRFSPYVEPLARALASYAAIALNNLVLVQELKELLDAFVKVIAKAIDAKSPHTSRHCQRVPLLTEMLVQAACDDRIKYPEFHFDDDDWYELRVAAWLHDCGKLATPDSVLEKATKLHGLNDRIESVAARFAALRQQRELDTLRAIAAAPESRDELESALQRELAQLSDDLAFLRRVNQGGEFMDPDDKERVKALAAMHWPDAEGRFQPLLSADEVSNLCIERGTLSPQERAVINNHMQVTIDMLESLPFPRKLRRVPEYAGGHHERMDGTGFPRGLTREQMSLPARMMAIADVFEALTAHDRPYKKPMKISESLKILQRMRDNREIDPDLYDLFLRMGVWEQYARQVLDPAQLDVEDPTPYF